MALPSLTSLSLRAPYHLGLDEDSSKELERCLDYESVQNLRGTCTASIHETGSLTLETLRIDENGNPTGPGEYGLGAEWMLSFRQNQTQFIATGDDVYGSPVWHDFNILFENDFMFAKEDQSVSMTGYGTFANGSMTLHIPRLGLKGKYELLVFSEQTYISRLYMTHPLDESKRYLWFEVEVHYVIENTDMTVALEFVVHIENTQYTDPSTLVAEAKRGDEMRRAFRSPLIFEQYYDNYGEEFGEEDEDDLTEEDKERRRRDHIENLALIVNKEDSQVYKVPGEWSLRSVTLQQSQQ